MILMKEKVSFYLGARNESKPSLVMQVCDISCKHDSEHLVICSWLGKTGQVSDKFKVCWLLCLRVGLQQDHLAYRNALYKRLQHHF